MPPFAAVAIRSLHATLLVASRLQIIGRECVLPRGPLIVVSNHMSYLDPPLMSLAITRPITFLAKEGVFYNPMGYLLARGWGAVPTERGGPGDLPALRHAIRVLEQDGVVGLFPEGTRDRGELIEAKAGVVLLATKTQAPILPMAITGTEKVRNLLGVFSYPHIRVTIGQPFTLPVLEGKLAKAQVRELTDLVMGRIAELLPPRYRGVYAVKPRARTLT